MRIGLGYVKGVRKEEMEALAVERERGGPYRGIAELASRSGAGLASLEKLAWAGALDGIPADGDGERRGALWRVGVTGAGRTSGGGDPAGAADRAAGAARAGAARRVGQADRRLPVAPG